MLMSDNSESKLLPGPVMLTLVSLPRKKKYPTCPKCDLVFSKECDLKLHLAKEEWDEYIEENFSGNFTCEECCLFFETKKGFLQHVGKMHERKYKYAKCRVCKKKFKNKYAVRFHVKQVHDKSTREKCPSCGKEFYNKYLIPSHLLKCSQNALRIR